MTSTKTQRRGLGRGLGSLIPTAPVAEPAGDGAGADHEGHRQEAATEFRYLIGSRE